MRPLMPAVVPSPARPPARFGFAGVHDRLQERAGGEDDRAGAVDGVAANAHAGDAQTIGRLFGQQILDDFLPER